MSAVRVTIRSNAHGVGGVWIDGREVEGCAGVSVTIGADEPTEVVLRLVGVDAEIADLPSLRVVPASNASERPALKPYRDPICGRPGQRV